MNADVDRLIKKGIRVIDIENMDEESLKTKNDGVTTNATATNYSSHR